MKRTRGFTALELLVASAIIGVLSAMVVPAFFRARAEARAGKCLSHVRSIAQAINMYMDDFGAMPPPETRPEVLDYLAPAPGNGDCSVITEVNPYLQIPVVLDPYLRSRNVWRCPEADLQDWASFIYRVPDWFQWLLDTQGYWGPAGGLDLCRGGWPRGWGGSVTDSVLQRRLADGDPGAFVQSIATSKSQVGMHVAEMGAPATFVVCADGGAYGRLLIYSQVAYPDICAIACGNCAGWADWVNCSFWGEDCGLYDYAPNDGSLLRDATARRAYTRHFGGSNLGFLDGHVAWCSAPSIVKQACTGRLHGLDTSVPPNWCGSPDDFQGAFDTWSTNSGGEPTLAEADWLDAVRPVFSR